MIVLAQQLEALQQQAQSIKAGTLPQVSVNGGYQYQENRYQVFQGLWMVNVGMQWKLFDGSTRHSSDAISRQALSLKEQRDDLSSMISLQVRLAWLDSQEAQKRMKEAQAVIEREEIIRLSPRDWSWLLDLIDNPPEPNAKLKAAMAHYQQSKRDDADTSFNWEP